MENMICWTKCVNVLQLIIFFRWFGSFSWPDLICRSQVQTTEIKNYNINSLCRNTKLCFPSIHKVKGVYFLWSSAWIYCKQVLQLFKLTLNVILLVRCSCVSGCKEVLAIATHYGGQGQGIFVMFVAGFSLVWALVEWPLHRFNVSKDITTKK
jgi:hypothetical protein